MKILMLQGYYEPEVASGLHLTMDLIQDLISCGNEVDVVTPIPTRGISDELRKKYKDLRLEKKLNNKLRIHRYWLQKEGKNPITRAIRYLIGGLMHIIKSLNIESDVIVISSTPPTNGIIAAIIKKIKKVPVLYVLQDVFPDSLVTTGLTQKGSLIWKIGRSIENITYKYSDKIIVVSNDFKLNLIKKGISEDKVSIIHNWIDDNKIYPVDKDKNELIKQLNIPKDKFNIVYAGNLGNAQNIEIILKSAELIKDREDIQYLIFGNGVQEDYYKKMANSMRLNNVIFYPLQPYEMVSQVYSLGDVSIISCKPGFGGSAMPSKTWSIMSTQTAVIANFDEDTELQKIIEDNEVGLFTKSGDVDELKEAILKLYENRNICNIMSENARNYIVNNLSRSIQTRKYIDLIKSIVGEESYV